MFLRQRIRREPPPDIGIVVPCSKVVPVEAVSIVKLLTCEFVPCLFTAHHILTDRKPKGLVVVILLDVAVLIENNTGTSQMIADVVVPLTKNRVKKADLRLTLYCWTN